MIENLLTEALREKIEEAVKDFRLPVKGGEMRVPTVINAYLPPKNHEVKDFPYVLIRAEAGNSSPSETETTVAIIIGCYSEEDDGSEHCINVMTRIRSALSSMENGILANKYVLKYPITWEIVPEQPWPQWQLDIVTKWGYNSPQAIF